MSGKTFFSIFILLAALSQLPASGKQELPEKEMSDSATRKSSLKILEKSEKKWNRLQIISYEAEISYTRAAFPSELITITVENDKVLKWRGERPDRNYSADFIESLTVKKMFEKIRGSIESDRISSMTLKASYDEKLGYINKLSRMPSEVLSAQGRAPFDAGYHIEIIKLDIIAGK